MTDAKPVNTRTTITDPALPAEERLAILAGVAYGLSPMHPDAWRQIDEERRQIEQSMAPACWACRERLAPGHLRASGVVGGYVLYERCPGGEPMAPPVIAAV